MKQQTLAMAADQGAGFETHRKRTRRDEFLDTMNAIVPGAELCAVVEPHYPTRGNGRPPIGLERMMRIHFIQHYMNASHFQQFSCVPTDRMGCSSISALLQPILRLLAPMKYADPLLILVTS
jgi:hypothetical protein